MKQCTFCNRVITTHGSKAFCSQTCYINWRYLDHYHKFMTGVNIKLAARTIKSFIILRDGHKCKICKKTRWRRQPIPLVLDHINGNPMNNRPDNLRVICCNCDAQTVTYKGRNRGHGRYSRRQRYKQGLSY